MEPFKKDGNYAYDTLSPQAEAKARERITPPKLSSRSNCLGPLLGRTIRAGATGCRAGTRKGKQKKMPLLTVLVIALGLAMDAFAVAIVSSVTLGIVSKRQVFRLSFHFGLFQAMMPVLGWLAGRSIRPWIAAWDHWAAFGLLAFIGMRAIIQALRPVEVPDAPSDPTRGLTLVALSLATSIDALAVGLSFAALNVEIFYPALLTGLLTCALTVVGMLLGSRLGARFGRRVEVLGGLVLIGIGLKILVEHLA